MRVGDLVGWHQPRPERIERLATLALVPLATALELELPLRDVVGDGVTRDAREGLGVAAQIARGVTDDDGEFDFPVRLDRPARHQDLVMRPDHRRRILHEQDRFGRHRRVRLLGVVAVVQTHAHDLAGPRDRRTVAQAQRLDGASDRKAAVGESGTNSLDPAAVEERAVDLRGQALDA